MDLLDGMRDQLERASLFLRSAVQADTPQEQLRFILGAVYPARVVVEQMRESAKHRLLRISVSELDQIMYARIPFLHLVWALRVHDFHRTPLRHRNGWIFRGSIAVPAGSEVRIKIAAVHQPVFSVASIGGGTAGGEFFLWAPPFAQVEPEQPPVHVAFALDRYLEAAFEFLPDFAALLSGRGAA